MNESFHRLGIEMAGARRRQETGTIKLSAKDAMIALWTNVSASWGSPSYYY